MEESMSWTKAVVIAVALPGCLVSVPALAEGPAEAKTFHVRHELTVKVPKNSKHVNVWFTLPQECPEQKTRNLKLDAPVQWRKVKDAQNNEYAYFEIRNPK